MQPSVPLAAQQGLSLLLEMAGEEEKPTSAKVGKRSCSFYTNKNTVVKKNGCVFSETILECIFLGV